MFGSHLSISGGLHNALIDARRLDMDCVQVFTKNQRQWTAAGLTKQQITDWERHRKETKINVVVSHDSYLINLASPDSSDSGGLEKSIAAFRDELERCEALGIPWLVTHPGSHLGKGEESEQAGLTRIAAALDRVHADLPGFKTVTCLEVTAGQGSNLGYRFEQLRRIIDQVKHPQRLAVCLDTAHLLAAGYDLTSAKGCRAVLQECDDVLGLNLVKAIHVNDSKVPRGSRVDRHEHIGRGHVSVEAFGVIVNHPAFLQVPKILETPKEGLCDGREWDTVNLEILRKLVGPAKVKKK